MSDALAREIINNTTLSAGQMLDIVDVQKVRLAVEDGLVSQAAADFAFQLSQSNQPLPTPGDDPEPEPSPTPDQSQLTAELDSVSSPSPERVTVDWLVRNSVTSGSGETLSGTVEVALDGTVQKRQSVGSVSPGGIQTGRVRLSNVSPGSREVCVRLQ